MPKWIGAAFKQEWRNLLSYRVDFWINFIGTSAIQFIIAYFLWSAIFKYSHQTAIKGMNFPTLMFYYLLAPLTLRATQGSQMGFISAEIYQGSLNKFLLYPLSYIQFKLVSHLANSLFYILQFFLVFLLYKLLFGIPNQLNISLINISIFLLFTLLGAILYFFLATIFELVAFWADNVWSLMVMLRFILTMFGGLMIPLNFFPLWSQHILQYLPFQYLIFFPMKIFMGGISAHELILALAVILGWTIICQQLVKLLWHRGCLQYSGVGI